MPTENMLSAQLCALSDHLRQRRGDLLEQWREAVRRDPELSTNARLPRSALDDHIPRILEDFERRLRAEHSIDALRVDLDQRRDAAEHGMHRWQQGYDVRETMREWGHLQRTVLRELDRIAAEHRKFEQSVVTVARETLAALCTEGNCESASRYVRLQQAEAASRVRDLEASLNALQALENERATLLREAAHDLRGSVGVIANATALLARPTIEQAQRDYFYDVLQQRIRAMGSILGDLVELSRLEAGQESLQVQSFDAAECLRGYCETLRPLMAERNLFLKCEGPQSLPVEGDALKVQRIIQNLMLNALKATQRGGVVVRWWGDTEQGIRRWTLSVSDSGPGFDSAAAGPLQRALKRATEVAHDVEVAAPSEAGETSSSEGADLQVSRSGTERAAVPSGEGIGLSIVKRLCEVLGATVALETAPSHGTTFRISFPLTYSPEPSNDDGSQQGSG